MSELLKAFYLAYSTWLDEGANGHPIFSRHAGLCSNVSWFGRHHGLSYRTANDLEDELKMQFADASMDSTYPFDDCTSYCSNCNDETQHLNPKRIAWVRNQVEKIKEQS